MRRGILVTALNQAVSDLRTSGTISDATARTVNAARGSPAGLRQSMRQIWQQARQILTPDQLQVLRTVQLGITPNATPPAVSGHRSRPAIGRRMRAMHTILSDPFVSLVQARAG